MVDDYFSVSCPPTYNVLKSNSIWEEKQERGQPGRPSVSRAGYGSAGEEGQEGERTPVGNGQKTH